MKYARIAGTGAYLPKNVVTNQDLEEKVETSHDWIVERTGIHSRHISDETETTSVMAYNATLQALENAKVAKEDIDVIIVATSTPDMMMPCAACLLQAKLGLPGVPAFDVVAACSGFVYALSIADSYIRSGLYKTVLVVGAEHMSSAIDWDDRRTCILFGDGAAATILQASDEPGIMSTHIHADGSYGDLLYANSGLPGLRKDGPGPYIVMQGREVFKFAVNTLDSMVDETLTANNLKKEDIDWLIPHQANLRIIAATAKKLNMSMDKVVVTVHEQGNTSAASVPLALHAAIEDGRVKRGDKLLLEAFGGGITWGSALIQY